MLYCNSTGYHNNIQRFSFFFLSQPPQNISQKILDWTSKIPMCQCHLLKKKRFRASYFLQGWIRSLSSGRWNLWVCLWQNFPLSSFFLRFLPFFTSKILNWLKFSHSISHAISSAWEPFSHSLPFLNSLMTFQRIYPNSTSFTTSSSSM